MAFLPVLSGRGAVKVFALLGWQQVRQTSSHIIMTKEGEIATLSMPDYKEVAQGTLRGLIRPANLTVIEFKTAAQSV